MLDVAVLRRARRSRNAPAERGGRNQHFARRGSRLAHGVPRRANARAASRSLIAIKRAGSGLLDFDLLPVGFQFFGKDHGQRGPNTLAHLGARDYDRNFVIRSNA